MKYLLKRLTLLPLVLSAVVIDFNGCWRPVTSALHLVGVDVSTDDGDLHIGLWHFDHDHDDDDD